MGKIKRFKKMRELFDFMDVIERMNMYIYDYGICKNSDGNYFVIYVDRRVV